MKFTSTLLAAVVATASTVFTSFEVTSVDAFSFQTTPRPLTTVSTRKATTSNRKDTRKTSTPAKSGKNQLTNARSSPATKKNSKNMKDNIVRSSRPRTPPCVTDTTKLGTLTVPTVGLGTISWSSTDFWKIQNDEIEDVIDLAYNTNSAFFDTAERYGSHTKTALGMGYGETEKMTKLFLERSRERQERQENTAIGAKRGKPSTINPIVATKFTPLPWRTTAESVVKACEQSCKNLGVDSIDLYQVHMPDIVQPLRFMGKSKSKDQIYWDGLAECYHRGLVKNVGVCNYGPTLVEECQAHLAKKGVPLASNQIGYSLLGRHNGAQETVDRCNKLGVKVLAYYPFAMGLLTGKYTTQKTNGEVMPLSDADASLFKNKKTSLERKDLARYAFGDGITVPEGGVQPLLETMSAIADRRGKTVSQVALNYIISKGAVPIPGCRTTSQLEDNLGATGWRLTKTEIKMLELEADKLGFGFDGAGFKRTNEKFVGYGVERWTLD